jgi:branched-subunit amino acid ABC-type transport system permease component
MWSSDFRFLTSDFHLTGKTVDFLFKILVEPWVTILTAPLFFGEVVIGGIMAGVMYSLVALGFVLIYKASGVFNFAQGIMVLFAALSLVGLMERGVPLLLAIALTGVIMLALALAIERVILRYMVNQEQIILFMATIGLTYFLEGFGETIWGSNVKKLDVGLPDGPLNVSNLSIGNATLVGVFAAALAATLAILFVWRARAVRRSVDVGGPLLAVPGPAALAFAALGVGFFLTRFWFGPEADFIGGRVSRTAMFLATLSWTGLAMVAIVAFLALSAWLGARQALRDEGKEPRPLHYGWFVLLGITGAVAAAAGIVWASRSGILINSFELSAAVIAAVLVIVLALFFQKTRVGRALRAVADDHAAALSVGISLRGIWVIVWAVAGLVALAAGIIWGGKSGVQFSLSLIALKALPVLILGGFTSVPGAIVGGLIIGVGEKVAEVYWGPAIGGAIENWFAYMLALAFLLFRPQGLFGEKIIERV